MVGSFPKWCGLRCLWCDVDLKGAAFYFMRHDECAFGPYSSAMIATPNRSRQFAASLQSVISQSLTGLAVISLNRPGFAGCCLG